MTDPSNQLRLRALDVLSDGILIADESGRIVYTNPSLLGLLGREPEGRPICALFPNAFSRPRACRGPPSWRC